jgi:hypothetical protein
MNLQLFAHKKGVGSSRNGRDSESKRLGVKCADGQFVLAGNILVNFKNVWGMIIWLVGSIGWVAYSKIKKEYALLVLYIVYSILNIMGIIMWS